MTLVIHISHIERITNEKQYAFWQHRHTNIPSRIISPHSWLLSHSITRSASHDRFVVCEIME